MIGPALGSNILLAGGSGSGDLQFCKVLYSGIGIVIALVALAFAFVKVPALTDPHTADAKAVNIDATPGGKLFQHRHFMWAAIAQFFNVAAQAGTWGFFINYGHEKMGF